MGNPTKILHVGGELVVQRHDEDSEFSQNFGWRMGPSMANLTTASGNGYLNGCGQSTKGSLQDLEARDDSSARNGHGS